MSKVTLYSMVYPDVAPGALLKIKPGADVLRGMCTKIALWPIRLKLVTPPKDDLSQLSKDASPMRFERAAVATAFLRARPERGDAAQWEEAAAQDLALGELVVLTEPILDWAGVALAVTLGEISADTGRIERAVDRLNQDPMNRQHTGPFRVADLERERLDGSAAGKGGRTARRAAERVLKDQPLEPLFSGPSDAAGPKAAKLKKKPGGSGRGGAR